MNKTLRMSVIAATAFAAVAGTANAESLLGKNYIDGGISLTKFGDYPADEIYGEAYSLSFGGNLNLQPNIDLRFAMSYAWADGDYNGHGEYWPGRYEYQAVAGMAQLVYFWEQGGNVTPYVCAGALLQYVNEKVNHNRTDDTDIGVSLGAGCDIVPTDEVLLRIGFDCIRIGDDNVFDVFFSLGYWLQDNMLGFITPGYDFESENIMLKIGGAITF